MLRTVIALGASLLFLGCTYEDRDHHHDGPPPGSQVPEEVASSTIDTGATLADIEPGAGAGAFVEYQGGQWHIYTTCDTALEGASSCEWDIIASVDSSASLTDLSGDRLEPYDYLDWDSSRSVRMVSDTAYDFDGFFVNATPGATLRVDVYLDGAPAPRFIYWVGDGGLHSGAPSNPIDLMPSEP